MGSVLIVLSGMEEWAYVVETEDGLRVRFDIDDWQRLNVGSGQSLPVRPPGKGDVWLFITNVSEQPPVVWVQMARRIRVAG